MSRSRKKAIVKDKRLKQYSKIIRRSQNQIIKDSIKLEDLFLLEIPNPKTIINDYDYSDYRFDCEYKRTPNVLRLRREDKEYIKKIKRK